MASMQGGFQLHLTEIGRENLPRLNSHYSRPNLRFLVIDGEEKEFSPTSDISAKFLSYIVYVFTEN